MRFTQVGEDVGVVHGWQVGMNKAESFGDMQAMPKPQLTVAALLAWDRDTFKRDLKKDGWKLICWYPSCHVSLSGKHNFGSCYGPKSVHMAYDIFLYGKFDEKAPLFPKLVVPPGDYPRYWPLSCSVQTYVSLSKPPAKVDQHRTMGIAQMPLNAKPKGEWRKFGATSLASYWFWGLKKGEDRYKLEDDRDH